MLWLLVVPLALVVGSWALLVAARRDERRRRRTREYLSRIR